MKYCNSSNEVILVLFLNTSPNVVTSAASAKLNSPSPLVSQLATQRAFTFWSAKSMLLEVVKVMGSQKTKPPLGHNGCILTV